MVSHVHDDPRPYAFHVAHDESCGVFTNGLMIVVLLGG